MGGEERILTYERKNQRGSAGGAKGGMIEPWLRTMQMRDNQRRAIGDMSRGLLAQDGR